MQRLTNFTLARFLSDPGVSAVMFGAPNSAATLDQAVEFAEAWLDCHTKAQFGYLDAFANVGAARHYSVRVLPTTMISRNGEIIAWIEGRHSSNRIVEAIRNAEHVAAAA